MELDCSFLPADTFGLSDVARRALAERPHPTDFDGLAIPEQLTDIPVPVDRWEPEARAELVSSLETGLAPFTPHVAVLDSIRRLAEPGATIVLAGQQPGFLGGPLLDLHKAAHAVRLARALQDAWGRPVVAGFWNHSDDHDMAEVHHLWIQTPQLELRKVGLPEASSTRTPLFQFKYDEERNRLGGVAELLRQNLWQGGPLDEALDTFLPRSGEGFGEAFTRTMLELFGAEGLIVFEPFMLRALLSRALAGALGTPWREPLRARSEALRTAGLGPAIEPEGAALLFRLQDGNKRALRWSGDSEELAYDDEPGSRTPAELAAEVLDAPDEFIAGALIRPLLQDAALPTAAYVGGWGELAYHLQLTELRRSVGVPIPPFVPRASATLVLPEDRRSLQQLEADLGSVLRAGGSFAMEVEEVDEPPEVVARLQELAERVKGELGELRGALRALDPSLVGQAKKAGEQVGKALEKLGQKAERVGSAQSGRGKRHLRRVNHGLVPRGLPQERVRGALEIAARFGTGWISHWIELIDPLPTEHVVLDLLDQETP